MLNAPVGMNGLNVVSIPLWCNFALHTSHTRFNGFAIDFFCRTSAWESQWFSMILHSTLTEKNMDCVCIASKFLESEKKTFKKPWVKKKLLSVQNEILEN